jgi:hypothetical protein
LTANNNVIAAWGTVFFLLRLPQSAHAQPEDREDSFTLLSHHVLTRDNNANPPSARTHSTHTSRTQHLRAHPAQTHARGVARSFAIDLALSKARMSIEHDDGAFDGGGAAPEEPVVSLEEARPPAEEVIALRQGEVLIKQTLLKADHFPGEEVGWWGGASSVFRKAPRISHHHYSDRAFRFSSARPILTHLAPPIDRAGCQNTSLTPLLDGAPNFRQVALCVCEGFFCACLCDDLCQLAH